MNAPSTAVPVGTAPHIDADPAPRLADPDQDRRSRKKQRTYDQLMDASARLFATRGFDETTTTDIAELADVSQRTLFRHFPTKEALLYGDMDDARLELRDALRDRPADEPVLETVTAALLSQAATFDQHRDRRLMQARLAARYPSVSAHSRSVVQASWEREIIVEVSRRLDVDPMVDPRPEILAGAAASAVRVATRQWTASGGDADYIGLLADALDAIPTIAELR